MAVAMGRAFLVAALIYSYPSSASALNETWIAESGAAASVIGSLTVDLGGNRGTITFQNGKKLPLKKIPGTAGVYTVDPPQDPGLKYGNRLCGMEGGVSKVEIEVGRDDARYLTVWSGNNRCAMYPMFKK